MYTPNFPPNFPPMYKHATPGRFAHWPCVRRGYMIRAKRPRARDCAPPLHGPDLMPWSLWGWLGGGGGLCDMSAAARMFMATGPSAARDRMIVGGDARPAALRVRARDAGSNYANIMM